MPEGELEVADRVMPGGPAARPHGSNPGSEAAGVVPDGQAAGNGRGEAGGGGEGEMGGAGAGVGRAR